MTASAQGTDISAFQSGYSAAQLKAYSFAFFRATEGASIKDANFAGNWAAGKTAGIHRGAYHELWPVGSASPAVQAAFFASTVKAQGVEPGDMLAVVSSDYAGVTGAEVLAVLNALKAEFPRNPVLIYSDLARLGQVEACKGFPLWLADYTADWPATPGWACKFWQWSGTGLDRDAFNGTAAELQAWIGTYSDPVKTPVASHPAPAVTVTGTAPGPAAHASGTATDIPAVTATAPAVVVAVAEVEKDLKELGEYVTEHP